MNSNSVDSFQNSPYMPISDSLSELNQQHGGQRKEWIPLNKREKLSFLHIIGLCCSLLAFQIAYSVGNSLGTPIMRRVGIPPSLISVVWIIGPLSGFVVQPLVGHFSDQCKFKIGRRRPFLVAGCVGIITGFTIFYFLDKIADLITKGKDQKSVKITIFVIAMLTTYISINTLQGPARALIGDLVPQHQQMMATTVCSAVQGFAAFLANIIGGFQLAQYTNGMFTDEQFMFLIAGIFVIICTIITFLCGPEEQLTHDVHKKNPFVQIFRAVKHMPLAIFRISMVYFFSWMAYYPFIIETTDFFGHDIFHGTSNEDDIDGHARYMKGVSFGMLTIGVSSALVLLYAPFQGYLVKKIGMKWTYASSQIIEAICLLCVFFVTDKYALLAIFLPLGVSLSIFNSIPFAVVGLNVPVETMGVYMGVLNCFLVVGQQTTNFILTSGVGTISNKYFDGKRAPIIGCASLFALAAAILCKFIIVPEGERLLPKDSEYNRA
ncbi:hypothetical protein M9Y10_020165 [Tritrichomonas musculus]|uniref:Major facilitator superfamily transporter n=1 Tax=Tritrichomonas musculus TaxID=1915356 RepID=A0ABR2HFG7_9EUKA